jgi:hypothetical protein
MQLRTKLSLVLVGILPIGALAPSCAPSTSTTKQLITCTTDPGTGVILRCAPGGGSGSGSGTCQDIDEDGDGEPHDQGNDDAATSASGSSTGSADDKGGGSGSGSGSAGDDDDHDGIPNERDCDNHPGEDHEHEGMDLPYDVRPQLGASARPIIDAFAEKGKQPASIVSVTMDGGTWRLTELQAGTAFTVTAADCSHAGNRDTGRDRVTVTWKDAANVSHSGHLDIRYCKN